jgi:hypothetical protein
MNLNRYNPRSRYRDRAAKRTNTIVMSLVIAALFVGFGFWIGRQYAVYQIESLKKRAESAISDAKTMQEELTKVRAEYQTINSRFEQLQSQYDQELPTEGPTRDLVQLLRKQLADGMPPERLSFLIKSARPPRNCSDPSTKRFMVRTPAYNGPDSIASIGEGAVSVSGVGASSRNKNGQLEAWFDPTQQVSVTFKISGEQAERKVGTLPMQHSLIAAGREYRFTLTEGEKSFIKVTFDSCDYP